MKKLKNIAFIVLSFVVVAIFGTEVFAAAIMSFTVSGSAEYYTTEISAQIWATKSFNSGGVQGESRYLTITGDGDFTNDVYSITGNAATYSNITANAGIGQFHETTDEFEIYVFMKNSGERYILPNVTVESSNTEDFQTSVEMYYFDISNSSQVDPLAVKTSSASPTAFISAIETEIDDNHYTVWQSNSSIDSTDVICVRIAITLTEEPSGDVFDDFNVYIGFMADIQYSSNQILSVYQSVNSSAPQWTKFGHNATLTATATKVSTNSLSNLYTYLRDEDANGNANITFGEDDYPLYAPVYNEMDLVNVDIATGEVIGKLSDLDYDFEWYGREITLESGTVLASGRILAEEESFTVDVYTYYPTMYIRRWVVGEKQWMSISDEDFVGSVEVPEYYIATFDSTIFNADHSVAYNSYGIIPRSYVTDRIPLAYESAAYLQNNYGYGTYTGSTSATTQTQYMTWCGNLRTGWINSSLPAQYRQVNGIQGENWHAFVHNILITIKYAHNDLQSQVGQGNVNTYNVNRNVKLKNYNGNDLTINSSNGYLDAAIGGGAIAVYNSSQKNTATYDSSNHYKLSDTGYNAAGFNFGYNSTYTHHNHRQGLFANQFLTYTNNEKRYLLDGFVGSDGYTSVFCVGQCNPWGNTWHWIFGTAVLYDGTNLNAYVNFSDYDYSNANTTWLTTTNTRGYASNSNNLMVNRNYSKMTYYLPTSNTFFRYFGTCTIQSNPLEMLVGIATKASSTGSETSGLCDYYYCGVASNQVYGIARGGASNNEKRAGPFYLSNDQTLSFNNARFSFRSMLTT